MSARLRVVRGIWYDSSAHRPLSSSLLGLPCRILNINHKKELLRGLTVIQAPVVKRLAVLLVFTLGL